MAHVSIIGAGNMGQAIAAVAGKGGHTVQLLGENDSATPVSGDVVVLAVPYPAIPEVIAQRGEGLAGKIVVDITNPLNFETFDSLVVPADSSAAAEISAALPQSHVLKAFNTTFAGTLAAGTVGPLTTTVLIAGDDTDAKSTLAGIVTFYQQAFGMTVVAREPRANAAFLRLPRSGNHHDLGLFGVGAQPPRPRGGLGLYHLAWQVDTIGELDQPRLTLAQLDAFPCVSNNGTTESVYGKDPDGNEFEVMWMLPRAEWGAFADAAPVERLDLPGDVRRWGGVRTAGELVPLAEEDVR